MTIGSSNPSRRAAVTALVAFAATPAFAQLALYGAQLSLGPGAEFGWATLNLATGAAGPSMNADERFPMCSTFKWLLAACVLSRVDGGQERLDREIAFSADAVQSYAPASRAALARSGGARARMTVEAMCGAAVSLSDNTAANLLLDSVGGPAALTAWLRAHGDTVTRLDRREPEMNFVPPGDPRDTTTPAAMVGDLHHILFGDVLTAASRKRLMQWMLDCKTGETRLKAGLPAGWRIAQKTGTLDHHPELKGIRSGASGDVGVLFPPSGSPILIAAYTSGSAKPQSSVDAWFASVARRVAKPLP